MSKTNDISLHDWILAVAESLGEVSTTTLGYADCKLGSARDDNPELVGAYIALVGENNSVQVAVAAKAPVAAQLSATLLGMEPEEAEELTEADIADGIGELVNMVAGGVKTRLASRDSGIQLGLPFVLEGRVEQASSNKVACFDASLGEAEVVLIVIGDANSVMHAAA